MFVLIIEIGLGIQVETKHSPIEDFAAVGFGKHNILDAVVIVVPQSEIMPEFVGELDFREISGTNPCNTAKIFFDLKCYWWPTQKYTDAGNVVAIVENPKTTSRCPIEMFWHVLSREKEFSDSGQNGFLPASNVASQN